MRKVFALTLSFILFAALGSPLFAEARRVDMEFRLSLAFPDSATINSHAGQPLLNINPLVCHGMSFGSDLFPGFGGTISMGVAVLGAFEENIAQGGQDHYGVATGGYWASVNWAFFDILEVGIRVDAYCGLCFLETPGDDYFAGYLGIEPVLTLAVNINQLRISTGIGWDFETINKPLWLIPQGLRLEFALGLHV
jgi:hypothetical protein